MSKTLSVCIAALLISTTACQKQDATDNTTAPGDIATAEGTVEGTWKADLASVQIDEAPSAYLLKDGSYSCSTCVPPLTVAADGAFHPVAERSYYDAMSVTVVDDKTVKEVRRKGDRVINEVTTTVSPDGKTLTFDSTETATPNAPAIKVKGTETRVAAAPAGAHAISGSWKTAKFDSVSDEGLTVSFDVEGDTLNMTTPAGQNYTAQFGGPAVPIKGDTGGTTIAVERLGPGSFRETNTREGKVVNVTTYTAGADGKLAVVSENKRRASTMRYSANKQ